MSKRADSAARWREIVRRQAGSGLSVAAFCRRARIPQASFYLWRRKLRDAASFAEVRVASEPAGDAGTLEVRLGSGRRIAVRPGFDRATLLALVEALEGGTPQDGTAESAVTPKRPAIHGISARRESGA